MILLILDLKILLEQSIVMQSYLVRKAVEYFLEEYEDYLIAIHRLQLKGKRVSLELLRKRMWLGQMN